MSTIRRNAQKQRRQVDCLLSMLRCSQVSSLNPPNWSLTRKSWRKGAKAGMLVSKMQLQKVSREGACTSSEAAQCCFHTSKVTQCRCGENGRCLYFLHALHWLVSRTIAVPSQPPIAPRWLIKSPLFSKVSPTWGLKWVHTLILASASCCYRVFFSFSSHGTEGELPWIQSAHMRNCWDGG